MVIPIMQVTIISGTNRPNNLSLQVAKLCQQMLTEKGLETTLLNLEDLPREIAFDYVSGDPTYGFEAFQTAVNSSNHFVFVAPEYNGSIPGVLKLFIDACDYPGSFRGKSAVLIGIAAGKNGNQTGLAHLQDILAYFGMSVFPSKLTVGKIREKLLPDGVFKDGSSEKALQNLLEAYHSSIQS